MDRYGKRGTLSKVSDDLKRSVRRAVIANYNLIGLSCLGREAFELGAQIAFAVVRRDRDGNLVFAGGISVRDERY